MSHCIYVYLWARIGFLRNKERSLQSAEHEIKELQDQIFLLRKQLTQDQRHSVSGDVGERQQLREEVLQLRHRVAELVKLLDELRNYNVELETANRSLPAVQTQVEMLRTKLDDREAALAKLAQQQESEGLGTESSQSLARRKGKEELLTELVQEHSQMYTALEGQFDLERHAHRETKRELAGALEELERCRGLGVEIKELNRQLTQLKDQNVRLAEENSQLQQAKSSAEREVEGLKSKYQLLIGALEQTSNVDGEVKLLRIDNQRLAERTEVLSEVRAKQEAVITEQEVELAQKRNEAVELQTSVELLQSRCQSLELELGSVRGEKEHLLSRIRQIETVFTQESKAAERDAFELDSARQVLEERLESVKASLEMSQQENRFLLEEVEAGRLRAAAAERERGEAFQLLQRAQTELELQSQLGRQTQRSEQHLLQEKLVLLTAERDLGWFVETRPFAPLSSQPK